ncbi:MAG: glycosyltransferase family A protein [Gammaproteobacteria bacterium]|jgi:hypothetical protein|nr:glycosyltransferase family 2 protein [Gammaproteobacteria bacterium]MDP7154146.1 glycosyltransferase family A protein [Gammaproteobacteria bacterium]MDP7296003.1 glycosyltransferase family A protein [Gammaproteobacteria bacterium]MDP7420086.1 glycosyltransferase family A protein [Gammaproteobacteria bacterium]MDP7659826.1 glycosyltransferase family A protein [Gammaproteobacteria bacterium]
MTAHSPASIAGRRSAVERYLLKRQFYPFDIIAKASSDLGLVVVIPCFDEPDIGPVLAALAACDAPDCDVEIIVVVNAPAGTDADTLKRNDTAACSVRNFAAGGMPDWMQGHVIEHNALPIARAGVGLARKIGMDEAAARIATTTDCTGVIACLDADCSVAPNYLVRLHDGFVEHPECPGVSIYFEHPDLFACPDPVHRAMIDYELHLRYYIAGQRLAGFPYAFHTVGSALACSSAAYVAQGGMNLRQGGEDFYFAQKLIAVGGYRALNDTTVYPGVRRSARVPFGTGPAINRALETGIELETFAPQIFRDLATFCATLAQANPTNMATLMTGLPAVLHQFLVSQGISDRLDEIAANVASDLSFRQRVSRWFNAFRFLKFAQFASRSAYPKVPVSVAARELAAQDSSRDTADLLHWYRGQDRGC